MRIQAPLMRVPKPPSTPPPWYIASPGSPGPQHADPKRPVSLPPATKLILTNLAPLLDRLASCRALRCVRELQRGLGASAEEAARLLAELPDQSGKRQRYSRQRQQRRQRARHGQEKQDGEQQQEVGVNQGSEKEAELSKQAEETEMPEHEEGDDEEEEEEHGPQPVDEATLVDDMQGIKDLVESD